MKFQSTRDASAAKVSAAFAIKQGLAADGGLFVPESIPSIKKEDIEALCHDDYPTRAAKILSMFLTDYTYDELLADCKEAYREDSFVGGAAPLHKVRKGLYSLELWHGPTA
ncbi:MAG: threonine synthase, partial [Clostridia bacterium]|nr:threonine synthase [Clostridia bacterium]